MKVRWTDHAKAQLADIQQYIARDSPAYGRRVVDRITRRSRQVSRFPRSGRPVPEYDHPDVREILEGNYRIIYLVLESRVDVISVIHQSQDTPWTGR